MEKCSFDKAKELFISQHPEFKDEKLFITSFYDIGVYNLDGSVEIIAESDCDHDPERIHHDFPTKWEFWR